MNTTTSLKHSLTGKVAFVQGGSRGIGAAIVQRLAQEGAAIAFSYANSAKAAQALMQSVEADGGRALALRADSADADAVTQAIDTAASAFGGIDILGNNAGVLATAPVDDLTLEDFDRTLAVNVRSVFVATRAAVRHMGAGGRVITIGSVNAERMPFVGGAAYAMSKSAIVGLTKGLARDLGPRGITVNNVQPGPVDTDMNPDNTDFAATVKGIMAINRYGRAEEIAGFVAYLASGEAGYITGASLSIDGGLGVTREGRVKLAGKRWQFVSSPRCSTAIIEQDQSADRLSLREMCSIYIHAESSFEKVDTHWLGSDLPKRSGLNVRELLQDTRHQRREVFHPIACRLNDEHGHRQGSEVLLKFKVTVHRQEHVELGGSEP